MGNHRLCCGPYKRSDDEWMKSLSSVVATFDIYGWYV